MQRQKAELQVSTGAQYAVAVVIVADGGLQGRVDEQSVLLQGAMMEQQRMEVSGLNVMLVADYSRGRRCTRRVAAHWRRRRARMAS